MDQFDFKYARGQFWRVGAAVAAFLGSAFLLQVLYVFALILEPALFSQDWAVTLLSVVTTYCIGMPLAIVIMRKGKKCVFKPSVKMKGVDFLVAFLIMYAISVVGNIISMILMGCAGILLQKEITNPVNFDYEGFSLGLQLFSAVVLAPIFEELLFRKGIVDATLPYGEGVTILLSAITFGLAHGNFFQFFYAAGIGALLAYIYIRTGKIRNTIILHGIFNFVGGLIPTLIFKYFGEGISPALLIYEIVIMGCAIAGIVLFIVNCRKIKINKPALPIPKGKHFITVYLNPGMILFAGLSLVFFVLSVLA